MTDGPVLAVEAFFGVGERAGLKAEEDSQLFRPEQLTRM
jgi:hypothetical protein